MNSFSNISDVKNKSTPKRADSFFFQPKLTINQPNDIYEQEADAMADKVMRMPAATEAESLFFQPKPLVVSPVQTKCSSCENEEKLQRKEIEEEGETIQLKPAKEFDIQRECDHCEEGDEQELQRKEINDSDPVKHPTKQKTELITFFQPKLSFNQLNDIYEQEADAMAEKVMRMRDNGHTQEPFFKPVITPVQRKCAHCEEEEKLQRKESNTEAVAPSSTESYLNFLSGGRALNGNERSFFEPRMGYDFSNVKIHSDAIAAKSAQSINALAYTSGNNIVFNQNQYAPNTDSGRKLLAHELTHTIQQGKSKQLLPADGTNNLISSASQQPNNNQTAAANTKETNTNNSASHKIIQRQPAEEEESEETPLTRPEEIALSRTSPGEIAGEPQPLTLSLYNFGIDIEQPKPEHTALLTELAAFLRVTATINTTIRAIGFADSTGGNVHNLKLSRRRADAIKTLLQPAITQHVSVSAYGETNPTATNDTVRGRNRNRRVDIRFATELPPAPQPVPRPRPVPPGQQPPPLVPPAPPPTVPPGTQPPSGGDEPNYCERYPRLCGIGITPFFLPLICLIAPEICLSAICLLVPELCFIPPPPPPPPPGGPEPPRQPDDDHHHPIVHFTPSVRALNTPAGMNDRVGLRDPVNVMAIVVNPPPATPITIDVDGNGSSGGEATINGQHEIQILNTIPLSILGIHMSAEGFAFNPYLQLAAWWSNDLVGESNRFSVSSIAENWSTELDGVDTTRYGYALYAKMDWVSDSGAYRDLDACRYVELVAVIDESGGMTGMGIGGVNDPDVVETGDLHPTFDQHGTPHEYVRIAGNSRLKQLFRIRDMRSNSGWAPSANSGFIIERRFERDPDNPRCWRLVVDKRGEAVTINGLSAGAGSGHAAHTFLNINCDPPPPPPRHDEPPSPQDEPPQRDNPLPIPDPSQDIPPLVVPQPPACDNEELGRRVDACIEQARQSAIDCGLGLADFSGGWGGVGTSVQFYLCIERMRRALLECDRKAKEDTHCGSGGSGDSYYAGGSFGGGGASRSF